MMAALDLLVQLGILGSLLDAMRRSRRNERRLRFLLQSLGVDPDDPPTWEIEEETTADGGRRDMAGLAEAHRRDHD